MTNPMEKLKIEKVTLNIGAGKDQNKLERGVKLIQHITGITPVKTVTTKRIPGFGIRPGLPIGCKLTLRGKNAEEVLKRLLESKDNVLAEEYFDENGNISFGVPEYIDIPGTKYDPDIGVMGLQVSITLQKPGYRIKRRRLFKRKLKPSVVIGQEDAMEFMKERFKVKIGEA